MKTAKKVIEINVTHYDRKGNVILTEVETYEKEIKSDAPYIDEVMSTGLLRIFKEVFKPHAQMRCDELPDDANDKRIITLANRCTFKQVSEYENLIIKYVQQN